MRGNQGPAQKGPSPFCPLTPPPTQGVFKSLMTLFSSCCETVMERLMNTKQKFKLLLSKLMGEFISSSSFEGKGKMFFFSVFSAQPKE